LAQLGPFDINLAADDGIDEVATCLAVAVFEHFARGRRRHRRLVDRGQARAGLRAALAEFDRLQRPDRREQRNCRHRRRAAARRIWRMEAGRN